MYLTSNERVFSKKIKWLVVRGKNLKENIAIVTEGLIFKRKSITYIKLTDVST